MNPPIILASFNLDGIGFVLFWLAYPLLVAILFVFRAFRSPNVFGVFLFINSIASLVTLLGILAAAYTDSSGYRRARHDLEGIWIWIAIFLLVWGAPIIQYYAARKHSRTERNTGH